MCQAQNKEGEKQKEVQSKIWDHKVTEMPGADSEVTVRRLRKIIQRICFAQSGASIRRVAWKWSGETRFPGALLLL